MAAFDAQINSPTYSKNHFHRRDFLSRRRRSLSLLLLDEEEDEGDRSLLRLDDALFPPSRSRSRLPCDIFSSVTPRTLAAAFAGVSSRISVLDPVLDSPPLPSPRLARSLSSLSLRPWSSLPSTCFRSSFVFLSPSSRRVAPRIVLF
jgi:hypothetical protein